MIKLDLDTLFDLAQNDPDQLERVREETINRLIQAAPTENQKRLRGLQFQVDIARQRSKNPTASCIAISKMMQNQLDKMRTVLCDFQAGQYENITLEPQITANSQNNVLPFRYPKANEH